MKFVLIINNDSDGVAQPALNLNKNLKKKGHKSKILTLHKTKKNSDIIRIKRSFISRLNLYLLNLIQKKPRVMFDFGLSTTKFEYLKKYIHDADVVIIFTFYKIISNEILENILKTKKIVYLRPCDSELISGGCHFHVEDFKKKFQFNCDNCPKFLIPFLKNIQKNILDKKELILKKYKHRIFVQNNYVKKIFNSSKNYKKLKTSTIYIGANKNRIKFFSKNYARTFLKINKQEKIILFGTFNLSSKVKGGHLLIDTMNILEKIIDKTNASKIRLITFGRKNNFNLNTKFIKWSHLGLIKDDKKLNLLLRASDVFVCPSLYCYGPHIVTEALLNNLKVVAFNSGVAQDNIIKGKNGFIVPCYNKKIFAKSIKKIILNKSSLLGNSQVNKVHKLCSSEYETNNILKFAEKDFNKNQNN